MKSRVKELEKILRAASEAYYSDGSSNLSDHEFDLLKDELESLNPSNDFLAEVGAPPSSACLKKVKHVIPMGSLKKINSVDEYNTWLKTLSKTVKNPEMAIEHKIDGVSIEICYENGEFKQAITRGDGQIGEDVTHSIRNASGFPKKINSKSNVFVRCECFIRLDVWTKHLSVFFANPRNAASGIVRRTDGDASKYLSILAFDALGDELSFDTEQEKISWLCKNNFDSTLIITASTDAVYQYIQDIELKRDSIGFEIDGVVVKVNSIKHQDTLGEHDGRPYWARAWKFAAMGAHTTLEDVEWNIGTQGTINPLGKVAPVKVGGTTIQNVTLHNADEIERLDLHIGDTIEIVRANDVIPKIVRVVAKASKRKKIICDSCPSCNSSVIRSGPKIYCSNRDLCTGSLNKRIAKWISKREIMFMGDSALNLLIEKGVVKTIACLYALTKQKMVDAGVGERMSEKILSEIEKSRIVSLSDFIGSLSLDMLGRSEAANLFAGGFKSLDDWRLISVDKLLKLDGYQQVKSERIVRAVKDNWAMIVDLSNILNIQDSISSNSSGKLSSKSFVFTGTMSKSRKELIALVVDNGGNVKDSVSVGLDYLVTDDPDGDSSKNKKADKLGIKKISEEQFLQMISNTTTVLW